MTFGAHVASRHRVGYEAHAAAFGATHFASLTSPRRLRLRASPACKQVFGGGS